MATEALKSVPITNLDSTPAIPNSSGQGGPGALRSVNGHVAATTGVTSGSTYRLVRIPTNACVKHVLLTNAALSTSTAADIDVAFSDSTTDGTPASLQGTIPQVSSADNKLFGAAVAMSAAQKNQDQTFAGSFTTDHQNIPLWQVLNTLGSLGWTSDPGGFFDILVKTTATVTAGGDISIEVQYVVDG
jgi:hypothetical protein